MEAARTVWDLLKSSKFAGRHEKDVCIDQDQGGLSQDQYTLYTAPQFLGPQIKDIISALNAVTIECIIHFISQVIKWCIATDNPLFNSKTGEVHHGGNFQAMAVTNAMEKTRLALHRIGKMQFVQATESMNPAMNRGLPPSLAASDPSLNYHAKGLDIAVAHSRCGVTHQCPPLSFPSDGTLSSSLRDMAGTPATRSQYALYILVAAH